MKTIAGALAVLADLEGLRVRLGADRIDALGHSFGALVAAACAATTPAGAIADARRWPADLRRGHART